MSRLKRLLMYTSQRVFRDDQKERRAEGISCTKRLLVKPQGMSNRESVEEHTVMK